MPPFKTLTSTSSFVSFGWATNGAWYDISIEAFELLNEFLGHSWEVGIAQNCHATLATLVLS